MRPFPNGMPYRAGADDAGVLDVSDIFDLEARRDFDAAMACARRLFERADGPFVAFDYPRMDTSGWAQEEHQVYYGLGESFGCDGYADARSARNAAAALQSLGLGGVYLARDVAHPIPWDDELDDELSVWPEEWEVLPQVRVEWRR